jgi:hypothetical protein
MIITIKDADLPKKINASQLTESIKAVYQSADIEILSERYVSTPKGMAGQAEIRSFGAEIIVKVADDADADVIKQIVASHAPERTDDEEFKLIEAQRLFDLLMLDPRMKVLVKPKEDVKG